MLRSVHLFWQLFLVLCLPAMALADNAADHYVQLAHERNLAADTAWLKLMHYHPANLYSSASMKSYVNDKNYFFAPDGRFNPEAELDATLRAYWSPVSGDVNQHPRCRFVSRYHWLEQELSLAGSAPALDCPDYTQWRSQMQAGSVKLIYASSHLNSPSSMYGHTLLRIDPVASENNAVWLSWGANFGANITTDDNSIVYAYKGLAGGYPGMFNVLPFYEKIEQYNHIENRDLWEYHLNLTPQETNRLVEHLWDVKTINFGYFFFDENCSFRLLELLEVARPGTELAVHFPGVAIPVDTVREVKRAGFVDGTEYRPSTETLLQTRMATLTAHEQALAAELMRGERTIDDAELAALPTEKRYTIYDTAYTALRFRERKNARDPVLAQRSYVLLRAVNALAAHKTVPPVSRPTEPELGHESSMISLRAGVLSQDNKSGQQHDDHRTFADAELRISFHDLMDPLAGYLPGAAINMGRMVVRQYEGGDAQLQTIDVVDINSLSPVNRFYTPLSWKARFGLERVATDDSETLVPQVNAGGGLTVAPTTNSLAYALATVRAEYNEHFAENFQAGPGITAGVLVFNPWGTSSLEWEGVEFLNGYDRSTITATQDIPLMKDLSLRFSYSHRAYSDISNNEAGIAVRWFY